MMSSSPAAPARRRFLALGLGAAVVLAAAGGVALSLSPAWQNGKLQAPGRAVFAAVLPAVVGGALPAAPQREAAIGAALDRVDDLISHLPAHAQAELAQLLSLVSTAAGRHGLVGLSTPWASASAEEVRNALQGMRTSGLALKRQAYSALRDLAASAYFSGQSTWASMGYPGPIAIA